MMLRFFQSSVVLVLSPHCKSRGAGRHNCIALGVEQATATMYPSFGVLSIVLLHVLMTTALSRGSSGNVCSSVPCGDGINTEMLISYPFWTANTNFSDRDSFCGYRPLEITCRDRTATLRSRSGASFIVKKINQTAKTLQLVDPGFGPAVNSCSIPPRNISFEDEFPGMSYSPSTTKLYFFLNCPLDIHWPAPKENKLNCHKAKDAAGDSYIFTDDMENSYQFRHAGAQYCGASTQWPVMREVIAGRDVATVFGEAIRKGFELQWSNSGDARCSSCELSRGSCVYTNGVGEAFRCRCPDNFWSFGDCHDQEKIRSTRSKFAIGIIGASLPFGILCIAFYIYAKHWKRHALEEIATIGQTIETFLEMNGPITLKRYTYSKIKRMSNSFALKLGQGGYGIVYKGNLPSGIPIAIKLLTNSKTNGEDFLNEVVAIGRTSHQNVVSLLGFCYEGSKRALIYEFMPNGSLAKFLFRENMETLMPLAWDNLYKISIGIARGLEYLHRGCKKRIVHFDIKPHNILLDEEFCPKISDFGLAKLFSHKHNNLPMVSTRGTIGYIAPEVFSRNFGHVSSKSDVYSFGMMILEMVGKRRNFNMHVENPSQVYFPHWIFDHLDQQKDLEAYDILSETEDIAKRMIIVGLWCIQTNPNLRPSIGRVVEMLEGSIVELQMPPKPYFCSPPRQVLESFNMSTF